MLGGMTEYDPEGGCPDIGPGEPGCGPRNDRSDGPLGCRPDWKVVADGIDEGELLA